ncbi:MAG: hypothetical protein COX77_00095 [Candidatus Komeilibacteria bacterium CG_4_10_14_0_2_um_filter_37_10]|uniref:ABC transporter domain-containing protein n=1 Tax=Candidatus Komeilibacteria bacterium CG_4_10_14_0_2_um_filter_37_10 TaxID=1974470 RepID=A0A2M7VGV0_9BACT|nr:MAG: hypothetical protein COX77_00095 [Candidatus Komeilibacteria bacterium CG_4_10_14_0_2_um_filter_37_10]
MIILQNLKKYYDHIKAVDDFSLEIKPGEIMGFLGPNGAGKTTTMKMLTGFIAPTEGQILVDNLDLLEDSLAIRKRIGYLPENNPLYEDMKVYEYLLFVGRIRGLTLVEIKDRMREVVKTCGIEKVLRQQISELSKGYRQRVGLAQALLHQPEILILDEPTSGLDPNQIVEIRELIKKIGKEKTVILCTHILSEVQAICDRVVIINAGKKVAEGRPEELTQQVSGQAVYYLKAKGDESRVKTSLAQIGGVTEVIFLGSENDSVLSYKLILAINEDIREKMFQTAVQDHWSILESHKEEMTLEDIFRKLTKQ